MEPDRFFNYQTTELQLQQHIKALEGTRHPETAPQALELAARYIKNHLSLLGYKTSNHSFPYGTRQYRNVMGTRCGNSHLKAPLWVVAHYDTVADTPGADDNASGVAVMLELARLMAHVPLDRTISFVGVNLEENAIEGYPETGRNGSSALACHARENGWNLKGAVVLESVAYANDLQQSAPPGIPVEVPGKANFVAVVGNTASVELAGAFKHSVDRNHLDLPLATWIVPGNGEDYPDTRRSDHASFWDAGYPAIMVTDTASFRNPHYHRTTDRLKTLNMTFAANVCRAVCGLLMDQASLRSNAPGIHFPAPRT